MYKGILPGLTAENPFIVHSMVVETSNPAALDVKGGYTSQVNGQARAKYLLPGLGCPL